MKIKILKEEGYEEALLGLSLSYNQSAENMPKIARRLAPEDTGENKFLRFVVVWLDVVAPRYWWQQLSTYKIGLEQLSESTMHTLKEHGPFSELDFEEFIDSEILDNLNWELEHGDLRSLKNYLPEGFLQRRILVTNYATLQRIINQRRIHRLPEWEFFIEEVLKQVEHRELLET